MKWLKWNVYFKLSFTILRAIWAIKEIYCWQKKHSYSNALHFTMSVDREVLRVFWNRFGSRFQCEKNLDRVATFVTNAVCHLHGVCRLLDAVRRRDSAWRQQHVPVPAAPVRDVTCACALVLELHNLHELQRVRILLFNRYCTTVLCQKSKFLTSTFSIRNLWRKIEIKGPTLWIFTSVSAVTF